MEFRILIRARYQEESRMVKHALEVHEGRAAVRLPVHWELEMFAVPGSISWQESMVHVFGIIGKVSVLGDEVMRSIDHSPFLVDWIGCIGRGEAVVSTKGRIGGLGAPASIHEGRLAVRGRGVAGDVHASITLIARSAVLDRKALPHEAVRVVGTRDAAVF